MSNRPIRAIILDLDGVVYLENVLLPGVADAIRTLRARGVRVLFVTNGATRSRREFGLHLTRLGIPCGTAEIMNVSHGCVLWVARHLPRGSRVLVFGGKGLSGELRAAGYRPVWLHTRAAWKRFRTSPPPIRAVVVAMDHELTYWSLCAAHLALQRGARLIAGNFDSSYPALGMLLPGSGSLVKLLEYASGVTPVLIGKPSPLLFRLILREQRVSPGDTLVVGDRLDIDVAAGRAIGARTALVLTGVDRRADIRRRGIRPDFVAASLPALLKLPGLSGRRQRAA
ncbi:MAG: HAD-IIA family hydrolase [Candidatus Coatesbacteria bacterium]